MAKCQNSALVLAKNIPHTPVIETNNFPNPGVCMKNFLKRSVLAVAITTMTLSPITSRAAVGLGGMTPLVYAGIGAIGTGGLAIFINESNIMADVYYKNLWQYGLLIVLGVVLLDGENGQEVEFSQLTPQQSRQLKISNKELTAYNSEIDMINILVSDASEQLSQIKKPNLEDSKRVWRGLKDSVSPEAFSAMTKIVNQSRK